jgi:hypothetical protein
VQHTGANRGWDSIWAALPAERAGLVITTNSNTGRLLYADASCEWSRAVTGDTSQLCVAIAGGRSFVVRASVVAALVLLVYLASVAVSVVKKRRVLRRPRGLRWARLAIFPLLALVWFEFWHTTRVSEIAGLGQPPTIAMPMAFRWLSLVLAVSLALMAVTAFFQRQKPRPDDIAWRQRAALAGVLGAGWLFLIHTDVLSRVGLTTPGSRPVAMLSAGAETVAIVAVFAAVILVSLFVWRRKAARRFAHDRAPD